MLARSITRSLRSSTSVSPCASCVCSCGRRFAPNDSFTSQKRYRTGDLSRASPAVYRQKRNEKRLRPLSAAEKKELEAEQESQQNWHLKSIERATRLNIISIDGRTAVDFLNAFARLCTTHRYRRSAASPVDVGELQDLVQKYDVTESDGDWLAHCLLSSPKDDHKTYGRKLMYGLSHAGSERATIRIMMHALAEEAYKPATLKASEIQHMRKHLKQIAEQGDNHRAMVVQGRVENKLGNPDAAIQLWTNAMDAAVARAEELAARRARGERKPEENELPGDDYSDLDSPWIELTSIHYIRKEWAKMKWAIGVGCDMDDPMSHYSASWFEKSKDARGEFEPTSTWLYHITKAASSGHPKAATELGDFYGRSGWKYIEDEPPDHIKPTPFDSYPPGAAESDKSDTVDSDSPNTAKLETSWRERLRVAFGFTQRTMEDPRENVFRTAAFPSDPVGRMRLAFDWLEIATMRTYAPANLRAAELHLEKSLWTQARTPPEALRLEKERYEFASKADKEAGKPIERPPKDENSEESEEIPNPFYDKQRAYEHIRQVFHAVAAQKARLDLKKLLDRQRRQGVYLDAGDIQDYLDAEERRDVKPAAAAFYRFPIFREMYMNDERGVCLDDSRSPPVDIGEEAKTICEEQKWDVYGEDGALLYRYGMAGGR